MPRRAAAAAAAAAADRLRERVLRAYVTPGHPAAYSAPATVASHFNISAGRARNILEHSDGYTLHREFKQPRIYNPYFVHRRREQVQADLIDVAKLSAENDGVRFLLVLIDIFTKKLWVYPLPGKHAVSMRRAMNTWLTEDLDTAPAKLMTDRGLEFTNRPVQELLRSHGVEWQPALGTLKACIAERVNKTLQILMYKHLTQRETLRYVDVLPQLVRSYNRRPHRTLDGMTPERADRPANELRVRGIFRERYAEVERRASRRTRFRVGDVVRLKTESKKISSSARAYAEQFHGEYYRIVRINRTLPVPLYYLRSLDDGEFIEGGMYANELQRQRGDVYKIERVLGRRRRNGREELLVKWKYFGDRWNQWVPRADVVQVY
jgi:transposase InsO family protein